MGRNSNYRGGCAGDHASDNRRTRGLLLDEFTLALMPECMRRNHGSFEEDEEWAFVFAVFEREIRELGSKENAKTLNSGLHLEILKREWPEEYTEWRSHAA